MSVTTKIILLLSLAVAARGDDGTAPATACALNGEGTDDATCASYMGAGMLSYGCAEPPAYACCPAGSPDAVVVEDNACTRHDAAAGPVASAPGRECAAESGCACAEGNCRMPNCVADCLCAGGGCTMPKCTSNCVGSSTVSQASMGSMTSTSDGVKYGGHGSSWGMLIAALVGWYGLVHFS